MNTLTINHSNGNSTIYQLIDGGKDKPIAYHLETDKRVISAIESARKNKQRVRIYLGDTETGKCWNEEHDIFGYIGLSKGKDAYYPILVAKANSFGGGAILDHCIIKIRESKGDKVLYQSENFQQPNITIRENYHKEKYPYSLLIDGNIYSNHKTEKSAILLKKKLS